MRLALKSLTMIDLTEIKKNRDILSNSAEDNYQYYLGIHHIRLKPSELIDWVEFLKDDLGFFSLIDVVTRSISESQFEIVYHLFNMGSLEKINLQIDVKPDEFVPSLIDYFLNADWLEREQAEMTGVNIGKNKSSLFLPEKSHNFPLNKFQDFKQWPDEVESLLPKLNYNPNKSEAPYPEESYFWKKFDLFSSCTMGNFEWLVCFDPNKVIDSRIQVGFHHQGIEKLFENKNLIQISHLIDKINLNSAPHYSIAWMKTIEELMELKIPQRAQALRLVMLELSRLSEHLTVLASICIHAHQDEYRPLINAREKILELFEKYCGHRFGLGIATVGGVSHDLPLGWVAEYQAVSTLVLKIVKLIQSSLVSSSKFRSLMQGGDINAQTLIQWGIGGPAMRAAGLNFDLRKAQPFYFYQDVDFDIPIGINGSGYDRFLVRIEEIYQSFRIITQVVENIPLGEVVDIDYKKNYPDMMRLIKIPSTDLWHYSCIESPSGEAGFLVKMASSLTPLRVKIKTPSFSIVQGMKMFARGLEEKQLAPCLASLGISRWELDR